MSNITYNLVSLAVLQNDIWGMFKSYDGEYESRMGLDQAMAGQKIEAYNEALKRVIDHIQEILEENEGVHESKLSAEIYSMFIKD